MKRGAWVALATLLSVAALSSPSVAADPPQFQVDPFWPKPLPNNWIFGQVASVATDSRDLVWVFQRPRSLSEDERGATLNPPRNKCCAPAPSVMEFDTDGNFIQGWGGPATTPWLANEHGIHVDRKGFVWLAGNGETDSAIFKYTSDGKPVLTIGRLGPTGGSNDTTLLGRPADIQVDTDANEVYVADGYGKRPSDDKTPKYDPAAPVSQQFANPVHCAKVSRDGFVYVCDRVNNRIQVFKKDGSFVTEWFYEKSTLGAGAVWDLNFWPDASQSWLFNIDGENNLLRILRRSNGAVVGGFGRSGRYAGQFHWVHSIAVDSKGNIYTGEVDNAKRVQKFKPTTPP